MNNKFSILVNSTDSFSDCWLPFFTLFNKFWSDFEGKIYLNTETKSFKYKNLNIISVKSNLRQGSWSECLKYAIDLIEEDSFIYMQEDYFLHSNVNNKLINKYFDFFKNNNFDCLHLTDQCNDGPFIKETTNPNFWEIPKKTRYRASTQAAFWKKKSFINILRPWESGWDFEKFGSNRSNQTLQKIMCVNQDLHNIKSNQLIPYIFTGIIKGKWKNEVKDLFKNNNIIVDFEKRGFLKINKKNNMLQKSITFYKIFKSFVRNYFFELKFFKF
jgi:hypothetical protein